MFVVHFQIYIKLIILNIYTNTHTHKHNIILILRYISLFIEIYYVLIYIRDKPSFWCLHPRNNFTTLNRFYIFPRIIIIPSLVVVDVKKR